MSSETQPHLATRNLLAAASMVIIVAGLRAAQAIVVPFLMALFIALITAPLLLWLTRRRVPRVIAVILVIVLVLGAGTGLAALMAASVNEFIVALPRYQTLAQERVGQAQEWLSGFDLRVPTDVFWEYFDVRSVMGMVGRTLSNVSSVLANTIFILLTAVFMLLEASSMPAKLRSIFRDFRDPGASMGKLEDMLENLNRYVVIKTVASVATGALVYVWLRTLGVDFPLLWSLLAFILNYVPNVGSVIAAIPAAALALVQSGPWLAAMTVLGYLLVNFLVGTVVEPRFMGRGLGLSTLVVILSLVFWGWVLGPVGMLLSAPLTMIVKVGLESFEDTRWLAVMLGSEVS